MPRRSFRPLGSAFYGLTLLVLAGTTSPAGGCTPLPSEPIPNYCEGKPDGTRLTLDREHDPEAIRDGTEQATVTCNDGKIDGPATVYLDDDRDQYIPDSYPAQGRLPAGSRVAEVARATTYSRNGENQGLYWNGPLTVRDAVARNLLEARIVKNRYGVAAIEGEFAQWNPERGIRREGIYAAPSGAPGVLGGLHGLVLAWHKNGQIAEEGYFCHQIPIGRHVSYEKAGDWTRVEDYSLTDYSHNGYAREFIRRVVGPDRLRGPNELVTSCDYGPDYYPLLNAVAVKRVITRETPGRPLYVNNSYDGANPWHRLPKEATFHQWFTPGSLIEQQQVDPFPRMTLQVSDDFDYVPLVERLERGQTASELEGMNRSIVEACGPWLRKAFELGPDL